MSDEPSTIETVTTEYSDGTTVETVTETTVSNPIEVSAPETIAQESGEIADDLETVSSDAVEIAQIEADKEITIAAIQAEAQVEQAKSYEGLSEWQRNLETQVSALMDQVSRQGHEIVKIAEALTPPILEQQQNRQSNLESVEADHPEAVAPPEANPPEPPKPVKKLRWI